MTCDGCRVLRKGCGESCIISSCLAWIERPESQGNATVFVAKFFGRASLMSFISAVPEPRRPELFKSLLFEACSRTINPVIGAMGLLCSDNWHLCHAAVETVLRGGSLRSLSEITRATVIGVYGEVEEQGVLLSLSETKRRKRALSIDLMPPPCDLYSISSAMEKPQSGAPSMISCESINSIDDDRHDRQPRMMNRVSSRFYPRLAKHGIGRIVVEGASDSAKNLSSELL